MILVLDIETARDRSLWSPPADQPDAFPPTFAHRVICIGYLLLDSDLKLLELDTFVIGRGLAQPDLFSTPADRDQDSDEHELLVTFSRRVEQLARKQIADSPGAREPLTICTFNGRRFDLPVLVHRCLKHSVPMPWYWRDRDMHYRYSERGHFDLADALTDFGAQRDYTSLGNLARLIGLPGKVGVDGSMVDDLYQRGEIWRIARYCLADVAQTALLMLRYKHIQWELPTQTYARVDGDLRTALMNDPRLCDLWGTYLEPRMGTVA